MGVLFLREHNRIARSLSGAYPGWDDERLFQTARNILTVILIKIVVEEYINHISPYYLKLLADPTGFRNPRWYRENWMAIEFNLLYRWHSLVPSSYRIGGERVADRDTLFNTDSVVEHGLGAPASRTRRASGPGRVGLFNSPPEVWEAELASVAPGARGRPAALQRLPRARALPARAALRGHLAATRASSEGLRDVYGSVDEIEFYPGLFAEDVRPNAVLPVADRPDGRDRRVLAGVHQPAARAARVQPADVLAARLGADPDARARSRTSCTATSRTTAAATT